jgi:hypothetical protein
MNKKLKAGLTHSLSAGPSTSSKINLWSSDDEEVVEIPASKSEISNDNNHSKKNSKNTSPTIVIS